MTFEILFYVCLSLAIVFFILSVVLFFIFDIKNIFEIRTGRAKRKTIKEMQEINSSTGRLRTPPKAKKAETPPVANSQAAPQPMPQPVVQPPVQQPFVAPPSVDVTDATEQLTQNDADDYGSTNVLSRDEGVTTLLNNTQYIPEVPSTAELGKKQNETAAVQQQNRISFNIVKEIMLVHSDEDIA